MPGPRSLPPSKKRKTKKDSDFKDVVEELEKQLTEAVATNSSLNKLIDLLDLAYDVEDPQDTSKGIYALYRVFVTVITSGKVGLNTGDDSAKVVQAWIWDRIHDYVDFLVGLLKDEEKFLRLSALRILFSLLKHLSSNTNVASAPSRPQFHTAHFKKIVAGILLCPPSKRSVRADVIEGAGGNKLDPDVRDLFVETWFSVHDDVRWFFLRESGSILSNHTSSLYPHLAENMLSILERLDTFPTTASELNAWWVEEVGTKPPKPKMWKKTEGAEGAGSSIEDGSDEDDDWRKFFDDGPAKQSAEQQKTPSARLHKLTIHQSLHSLASHRAVFTRAWLMLLPHLSIDVDSSRNLSTRALNVMHRGVLPHLTRPILVMDWVSTCVDFGGPVGLLALNALFVLMREYNLDYPSFYTRLYAFVTRDVLHLKHRARFFRMTELFLSSTHLPATLLASFIKRLSRLSLNAPPSAIIMIIPFTYNILKRHPALMAMIHRAQDIDCSEMDQFDANESNPNITGALQTSLWELHSHRNHYHSGVSTLARIFEEAFTKPGYSMEDFLDHTYGTLFDAESKRRIKKEPAVAMELKSNTLLSIGPASATTGDLVSDLWVFG